METIEAVKKSKIWVGEFYPGPEHYESEANQTVGQPLVGKDLEKVITNRHSVDGKLSPLGELEAGKVVALFLDRWGMKVRLQFSKYCGCTMCPCSPGFKVIAEMYTGSSRVRRDDRVNVYAMGERVEVKAPKFGPMYAHDAYAA